MFFSVFGDGYEGILARKMKIIISQEHMVSLWRRKMLTRVVPHCTSAVLPRSCIQHATCSFASFLPHPQCSICFPTLTKGTVLSLPLPGLTHGSSAPGARAPQEAEGPLVCTASGSDVFLSKDHAQRKGCTCSVQLDPNAMKLQV